MDETERTPGKSLLFFQKQRRVHYLSLKKKKKEKKKAGLNPTQEATAGAEELLAAQRGACSGNQRVPVNRRLDLRGGEGWEGC